MFTQQYFRTFLFVLVILLFPFLPLQGQPDRGGEGNYGRLPIAPPEGNPPSIYEAASSVLAGPRLSPDQIEAFGRLKNVLTTEEDSEGTAVKVESRVMDILRYWATANREGPTQEADNAFKQLLVAEVTNEVGVGFLDGIGDDHIIFLEQVIASDPASLTVDERDALVVESLYQQMYFDHKPETAPRRRSYDETSPFDAREDDRSNREDSSNDEGDDEGDG